MFFNLPESRTILSQGVQDGICDVGTARHAQGLQAVTTPANGDESLVCDLLFTQRQSSRLQFAAGRHNRSVRLTACVDVRVKGKDVEHQRQVNLIEPKDRDRRRRTLESMFNLILAEHKV